MVRAVLYITFLACAGCLISCNKKTFLEEKPNSDLFVPTTLDDFQKLLDNDNVMSETPVLGELSSDNYYITNTYWQSQFLTVKEHNAYVWEKDIYNGEGNVGDWNLPYKQVLYANVILEGLKKITITDNNVQQYNFVKGSALFIRAYAFFNLAQVFAPVYDAATATSDLGIPLRLNPNIDEETKRSTVEQTYAQLTTDLQEAKALLPPSVQVNSLNRPSRPAALAQLARTYLSMRLYDKAGLYADSCLQLYDSLYDYNQVVNTGGPFPFKNNNPEVMYQSKLLSSTNVLQGLAFPDCIVDSILYKSYASNDKRKLIFYVVNTDGNINLKGSYNGSVFCFSGLATDEIYLVRAECNARAQKISEAMSDLNKLLKQRWLTNTFVPYSASTPDEALDLVLAERRKELPFRGVRWSDLRRFNKEGRNATLTRLLNGQEHTLPPNDPKYVLPIPPDVIKLTDIPQNNRD
jgi:starch-binding outer membrane protein, SusD/RagB family